MVRSVTSPESVRLAVRPGFVFWVLLTMSCVALAGTRIRLDTALDQLQAQGIAVVYTTALVSPDLYIDLDPVTLEGLRRELPALGLALENRSGTWLVVQGPKPVPASQRDSAVATSSDRLETIIVTGTRHRFATIGDDGANVLSAEELDRVPTLGGDSLRSANLLPGMSSMGVSVRPRIRGGLDDELLVLLDGVEILDPYHFANYQNLFSSIDGRAIDDIDVYSGGFPARYGNRMSGVMSISTLAQRDKPTAEVGITLFSAFANTRNPDPDSDTTWLASVRYGQSDVLLERLGLSAGRPGYSDAILRVGHEFAPDAKLYVGDFYTHEDISLSDNTQKSTWKTDNNYLWSRFDTLIDDHLTSSTTVSYLSGRNQTADTSPPGQDAAGFLDDSRDTRRFALRSDFGFATGQIRQEFGMQADWTRTSYDSNALIDRGATGVLLDGEAVTAHDISMSIDGTAVGLYWTGDIPVTPRLSLQPGVRWDLQDAQGTNAEVSPRLGLKWLVRDDLTLRFDAGRYYQFDGISEIDTADGVDALYKPQRADHYIASTAWRASANSRLRLDLYDKQYDRTTPRFENLFNPFEVLPQVAPDRVEIDATRARAHGVDFEFQNDVTPRTSVIARYSYMDADDKIEGQWVSRRWSQRQTATGIVMWKSDTLSASAAVTWHSGWRTSAPPASVPAGFTIPLADIVNNRVLHDYVSLDLGCSATHPLWRSSITVFADVTNALNRDNSVGVDYVAQPTGPTVQFSPDNTSLLPIVTWVGIVIAF